MAVRIHFSADDLAQVRVATEPDPMWEVLLSLHLLQTRDGPLIFDAWRRRVSGGLTAPMRCLLTLARPRGYSPDFLTPAAAAGGLDLGIDALLSTSRDRLRHDLTELAAEQSLPSWAGRLAEGDREILRHLGQAIWAYHHLALAPYRQRLQAQTTAHLAAHVRSAHSRSASALGRLMAALHPRLCWADPVLTVHGLPGDWDLHLQGRGLLLLPSFFCWRVPTLLKDPVLPPVVVYPIDHSPETLACDPGDPGSSVTRRNLVALLGRTRAVLLEAVASGRTTSELARHAGIAAATVSHHTCVLREAGLIVSRRMGGSVHHTLTPLGADLLGGGPMAPAAGAVPAHDTQS
ncbi:ArsR/SmtB family transcription factor [Streptomyces chattanoogensis]